MYESELRGLKLHRVREKLDICLGPLQMSLSEVVNLLTTAFMPMKVATLIYGSQRVSVMQHHHLDQLTNGEIRKYYAECFTLDLGEYLVRGERNLLPSFVGPEVEAMIRENPDSEIADIYFGTCRRLLVAYKRVSSIIYNYAGHLFQLQTLETYKKEWPSCVAAVLSRFLMPCQIMTFTSKMEDIAQRKWELQSDYSVLYNRGRQTKDIHVHILPLV